ncbi:Spc97 / Spc98 family protein [Nitzschia inconspicua]|uniref:Spc97 / Spc98 family protein n=1 Tax=Nitzschia inconspicua TaxID=303405 RepID=A0A9K3PG52_9STRA|nr:Spc97 / Spc98 family protein [Nitzschia inconspicua]
MHRKDTPAARAALAKRRQRAAQNLNTGASSTTTSTTTSTYRGGNSSTAAVSTSSSVENHRNTTTSTAIAASTSPLVRVSKPQAVPKSSGNDPRPPTKQLPPPPPLPQQQKRQQQRQQQQEEINLHWKGLPSSRRTSKVAPLHTDYYSAVDETTTDHNDYRIGRENTDKSPNGAGHTVAGQTMDGTMTTAAMTDSIERSQQVAEHSSKLLDTSLSKSKSYDTSYMGEPNIETVLKDDGYVQEVEVRHRRHSRPPNSLEKPTSPTMRERISNFGFVEVHSPQPPNMSEQRAFQQQSHYPQPRASLSSSFQNRDLVQHQTVERRPQQQLRTIMMPYSSSTQQTMRPSSTRDEQSLATANDAILASNKNLHLPSLASSTPIMRQYSSRDDQLEKDDDNVATPRHSSLQQSPPTRELDDNDDDLRNKERRTFEHSGQKTNVSSGRDLSFSQQGRPPTSPTRPFQRPPSPVAQTLNRQPSTTPTDNQNNNNNNCIEKSASLNMVPSAAEMSTATSVGRLTVSTGGLSFYRKSKIPSPTPIDVSQRRPSPRSQPLPPSGRNTSPPKPPPPQLRQQLRRPQPTRPNAAASVASSASPTANTSRIPTSKTEQSSVSKPSAAQSFMSKRRMDRKTTTPVNTIRPVSAQSTTDPKDESSPKQPSPRVDRLSVFLKESLSVSSSQQPQLQQPLQRTGGTDPVLQSRVSMDQSIVQKTVTIQRPQPFVAAAGSQNQRNINNKVSNNVDDDLDQKIWSKKQQPAVSPIEMYRAEADEYDLEQQRIEQAKRQQEQLKQEQEKQYLEQLRQQEQKKLHHEEQERIRLEKQKQYHQEKLHQEQQEMSRLEKQQQYHQEKLHQEQQERIRLNTEQQIQQDTPKQQQLNQYQFQYSMVQESFSPRTPQMSKSQTVKHEDYSYESPGDAFKATANRNGNIFQTPQHLSPFPSNEAPQVEDHISVGDIEEQLADAACLCSGHAVVLRSCQTATTIQSVENEVLANMGGPDLGLHQERLVIEKVSQQEGGTQSSEVRFGDVVILRSTSAHGKAFGTRKRRNDIKGVDELGFFDIGNLRSDRWTVLPVKPGNVIVIGRAALSLKKTAHEKDAAALVKSGSPVLLRNCYNGGVLSVRDGKVILMTDSYHSSQFGYSEDPTFLGRLQNHHHLVPTISESFQLLLPSVPPCPSWSTVNGVGKRIFLDGTYIKDPQRSQNWVETSGIQLDNKLDPKINEKILIDEVVGSFIGLEGLHVKLTEKTTNRKGLEFHLSEAPGVVFDRSLHNLIEQILPLSTSYVRVRNFVLSHYPGYEYGRVMQALCEGLDSYLYQYTAFVADLEQKIRKPSGSCVVTMKSIHFEITPLLHSMSILEHITGALAVKKGGALINSLWSLEKRVYMGDSVAKDLIGTLLDKCSTPYVEMLSTWLQSGILRDPYNEFMVVRLESQEKRGIFDGDSWMTLFRLNEQHIINDIIPNEKLTKKILVTGKYWNAVQACDVEVSTLTASSPQPPMITKFRFQSDSSAIATLIDTTYQNASKCLINLLKEKYKLMHSLQVMKRYFLLDQGDFFMHFLDSAEEELMKPFEDIASGRVQHSLTMSIQLTEAQREGDVEPFLHDEDQQILPKALRCRFMKESLVSYLDSLFGGIADQDPKTPSRQPYGSSGQQDTGFDLFTIDFALVPFPTSLILSRHSMQTYKLLFRQLLFAKHVERRLVGVWSDHQLLKKLDSLRGLLGTSFLLRQRMLHFVQNLNNYMTFEVIENNWMEMIQKMNASENSSTSQQEQTVDDILEIHDEFLEKTLDACLLRNPVLIKSLTKLLKTCLLFTDQMKRFMNTTRIYDDSINLAAEKRGAVQRNLNERGSLPAAARDTKKLRRALDSTKEERLMLHQRQTRRVGREVCSESYKRMIHRFEEVFSADLALFMMQLNSHTSSGTVANLAMRLDWNGFLTATISSGPV